MIRTNIYSSVASSAYRAVVSEWRNIAIINLISGAISAAARF